MVKFRLVVVSILMLVALAPATPHQVSARPDGWYSDFYNGWTDWDGPVGIVGASARLSMNSRCVVPTTGPVGSDFDFSFRVGSNCVAAGQANGGVPVAVFSWKALDEQGRSIEFPCLNVRGSVSTEGEIGGWIEFGPLANIASEETNTTNNDFTEVASVDFTLFLDYLAPGSVESLRGGEFNAQNGLYDQYYDIEIVITRCGWDGPNIDIEHYQQMAEQAEALPNTR